MTTRRGFLAWIAGTVASARATAQATAPADPDGGVAPDLFSGAPAPDDPLEFLYSRRLAFDGGQPLITVRVAEGRREALLLPRGALQADARSASGAPQPAVSDGAEGRWSVRLVDASAGVGAAWVELEEIRYGDREGLARAREGWDSRGVKTRITTVGQVYGIAGHVVDTRKYAVLAEGDATEAGARAQAAELTAQFEEVRPQILREMASRPSGRIELLVRVARFEWLMNVAAHAADSKTASPECLAGFAAENAVHLTIEINSSDDNPLFNVAGGADRPVGCDDPASSRRCDARGRVFDSGCFDGSLQQRPVEASASRRFRNPRHVALLPYPVVLANDGTKRRAS